MYRLPTLQISPEPSKVSTFNSAEYCVDGIRNFGEDTDLPYRVKEDESILFVCATEPKTT